MNITSDNDSTPALAALRYASMGWRVLPLHTPTPAGCSCGHADCSNPGKHPRLQHGVHEATSDSALIERMWRRRPNANVGIATGEILVVDVDGTAGRDALARLEDEHEPLPSTLTARTGGGLHFYLRVDGEPPGNSSGRLPGAIHVRGVGGYAVAPPSLHASGVRYQWERSGELAPLPPWLDSLLREEPRLAAITPRVLMPSRYVQAALEGELQRLAAATEGTRNETLNAVAFRLGQLDAADDVREALLTVAESIGLGRREARATIASGLRAGRVRPRTTRPDLGHPVR
jgi:hypothetical protein